MVFGNIEGQVMQKSMQRFPHQSIGGIVVMIDQADAGQSQVSAMIEFHGRK